jgi:hypothetical protein
MAATAIHRLTLDPMGKCSNAFFSETTNMIKAKLYMNVRLKFGRGVNTTYTFMKRGVVYLVSATPPKRLIGFL